MASTRRASKLDRLHSRALVEELFEDDLHARRVLSLANGVTGVLRAATLSVHAIGEGYAEVAKTKPRFGVKQVDRFLNNTAIDVAQLTPSWTKFVVGVRKEIVIALDWTDFEKDDHTTLCAYLVTSHGRATPLQEFRRQPKRGSRAPDERRWSSPRASRTIARRSLPLSSCTKRR